MEQDSASEHLSPDEFIRQLNRLPTTDVSRIMVVAMAKHVNGTGMEYDDLLQESIVRVLEGSRKVPRKGSIVAFLIQTIRSIAFTERKKMKCSSDSSGISWEDKRDELSDIPSPDPSPEQIIAEAQETLYHRHVLEQLGTAFRDDPNAQAVLQGKIEGLSSSKTQENVSMTAHEYDAARKRVDRSLLRIKTKRT